MPEAKGQPSPGGRGRTILLVDADSVYVAGKSRELEAAGFRVLVAPSADAAAAILRAGGCADLLLMDVRLDPAKVKAAGDLPLLFLYADADSASVEKAASRGAYGLVDREADAVVLVASALAALAQAASRESLEAEARGLRREIERLGYAFEGSGASWWDWNVETGEMLVGSRWSSMLGYESGELGQIGIGTFELLVHPDDAESSAEVSRKYRSGEISSHAIEIRMRRKDGAWLWILDRGKAYEYGPGGEVLRVSGANYDISDRKAAEERQRLLVEQAQGLMRELRHRVKNGLNLASSLLQRREMR